MDKRGHPVATLPSDGGDYTSFSQIVINSANHHHFPGHKPTMPGFDPNYLAHQQPHVVKELPGFDPNHQITAPEAWNSRSAGCRTRHAARSWLLKAMITRTIGGKRLEERLRFHGVKVPLPDPRPGGVLQVPPLSELCRQVPLLLSESRRCLSLPTSAPEPPSFREFHRVTGQHRPSFAHLQQPSHKFKFLRCRLQNCLEKV
eukprot:757827-Pleurochrysis_carterae.AAC.1